jgi:hypothetical protein
LLIYDDEKRRMKDGEVQLCDLAEHRQFATDLAGTGRLLAGNALRPISTATSVRVRNGKALVTDGPFAETKEQLGGFYMVEAKDLDEAVALASRIPSARHGTIEVRPIWEIPGV